MRAGAVLVDPLLERLAVPLGGGRRLPRRVDRDLLRHLVRGASRRSRGRGGSPGRAARCRSGRCRCRSCRVAVGEVDVLALVVGREGVRPRARRRAPGCGPGSGRRRCRRARDSSPPPIGLFSTRPPTRSRASSTITVRSSRTSSRAAVSPAKPAPITTTSASRLTGRLRRRRLAASASGTPAASAAAPRDRARFEQLAPAEDRRRSMRARRARVTAIAAGDRLSASRARGRSRTPAGGWPPRGSCSAPPATSAPAAGTQVAITPTGAVLAELEPEQVTVVDLDGRQVDGELAPTSELDLHLGVYRALRRRRGRAHPRADGDRALVRARRAALRPLLDAAARRDGAGGALRDLRHARAGARRCCDALEGRTRGADGQPRRHRLRPSDARRRGRAVAAARVGLHGLLARRAGRRAARARRGGARGGGRRRARRAATAPRSRIEEGG